MRFYLGTHVPAWLSRERGWPKREAQFAGVPLFVSARRLRDQQRWRKALAPWALDSGGFTELSMYGKWTVTPAQYVADVYRWSEMIGVPEFCAPQDWMCEPVMVEKTGKSVRDHQELTIANYLELKRLAPDLPFIPVLQGWHYDDYMRHVEDYARSGVRLAALPTVGVGSVCRRQDTGMAEELMRDLHGLGIKTHGFGFKLKGLERAARWMSSADSMAWSMQARRGAPLPVCSHRNCANCALYALNWREKALRAARRGDRVKTQPTLF